MQQEEDLLGYFKMKKLLYFILMFLPVLVFAQTDTLTWSPNFDRMQLEWDANEDGDFSHYEILLEDPLTLIRTTDTTFTIILRPEFVGYYRWGVVVVDTNDNRSDFEGTSMVFVQDVDIIPPAPVRNLRVIFLEPGTSFGFQFDGRGNDHILYYALNDTSDYDSLTIGKYRDFDISLREPTWLQVGYHYKNTAIDTMLKTAWIRAE